MAFKHTATFFFFVVVVVVARTRLSNSPDTGKVTILMRKVMHRDHEQNRAQAGLVSLLKITIKDNKTPSSRVLITVCTGIDRLKETVSVTRSIKTQPLASPECRYSTNGVQVVMYIPVDCLADMR